MGCHALLQGIFLTQGSNLSLLCLLHCGQILYWATREAHVHVYVHLYVCVYIHVFVYIYEREVTQSCLTLSDPMDCSLLGSSVHGIFQARVLDWGAIDFSIYIYIYTYTHIYVYIFFQVLFDYRFLEDIEYSSLCYTIGPCCLTILYIVVCTY